MTRRIAGVDEAGRGPVIGPMVVAGVALDESLLPELESLGVNDSKRLSARRREEIAAALCELPGVRIVERVIAPPEIDAAVRNRSFTLNGLTISCMAGIVEELRPDAAFLDLVGHSPDKFARSFLRLLSYTPAVTSSAGADGLFLVTGAASIIAKTRRDAEIAALAERYEGEYGPLGSGYPSDPCTQAFLKRAWRETAIIRTSWACYGRIAPST